MYAHQVIDGLMESQEDLLRNVYAPYLKKSIHFSFVDIPSFYTLAQNMLKRERVFVENNKVQPPYQNTSLHFFKPDDLRLKSVLNVIYDENKMYVFEHLYKNGGTEWKSSGVVPHLIFEEDEVFFSYSEKTGEDVPEENAMAYSSYLFTIVNAAFLLLDSKNITTIDNPPPEKLNKKRAKSGKCPLFTYKTLVIKPIGKKQTQSEAQGLWENRVHLCRGHFKAYTEENPLFGRLTGRYWWQPSVRGNKKKGVVMKDYEVRVEGTV